jgi:subtilisin family serine protease
LAKTENTDSETPLEEDNWIAAAEWADSLGADVFSTSLGYLEFDSPYQDYTYEDMNGNTAAITIAADLAVKKGIVLFNSAGNNGFNSLHNTLNAPADGDSVFAIGAVYSNGSRVSFSSVGPTYDGRIKPDFMAMGAGTYAAGNNSNTQYISFSGTSASCPLAAGIAALLLEKDYNLTPIEIRQILRNTSSNSDTPNNSDGWGILNALAAINQIPTVKLSLKVYLQGSYDTTTSLMKLDINSLIPKQSPYPPNSRRVNSIPINIVDWILVELRETPSGKVISSKSFLLRNDGAVVDDDGINETIEMSAPEGNYYIVIKNRNHLAVMSHVPVSLTKN